MTQGTPRPDEAAARLAIMDQLYRYCRAVDRLDIACGHGVFHPDATADFSPGYTGTGRGWIDHICAVHREFLHHSHQVTNVIIDLDGDRAGSESYVFATLQQQDGEKVMQHEFWARYIDSWSWRDGVWAIDARECIVDYGVIREVDALHGNPRSARDATDPSYAVLRES